MNSKIRSAFLKEYNQGKEYFVLKDFDKSFQSFERSHIIGQKFVIPHFLTHWWMLRIGLNKRCFKEVIGQFIRIPLGIIGSLVGIVPVGNTGGSNIPLSKSLKLPKDIEDILS